MARPWFPTLPVTGLPFEAADAALEAKLCAGPAIREAASESLGPFAAGRDRWKIRQGFLFSAWLAKGKNRDILRLLFWGQGQLKETNQKATKGGRQNSILVDVWSLPLKSRTAVCAATVMYVPTPNGKPPLWGQHTQFTRFGRRNFL